MSTIVGIIVIVQCMDQKCGFRKEYRSNEPPKGKLSYCEKCGTPVVEEIVNINEWRVISKSNVEIPCSYILVFISAPCEVESEVFYMVHHTPIARCNRHRYKLPQPDSCVEIPRESYLVYQVMME